ncbi:AAA family ATPase [Marinimicrobium koreense]|jgi:MoxR-like ATPase|uniref:MoxR-like ATPase n=1 Tax=Marinimicrobium koreense TaxID=306545 RepID=A0A3N1P0X5_9GAMM|nr:MoxR family ATPase [Marinimicrobium koreense]ROQ20360.1 MoxR-like ATPase [Marinimicrobium koreense]
MRDFIQVVVDEIGQVLLGKEDKIKLALACLLSDGHLLIEDLPGMGKTTLAHALAKVLGLSYQRIQFTSDMLPADIIGVSVFEREQSRFTFHPGPVFTQLLLADEINRTTPKTQSALLEAMEERQVTVEGETRKLEDPFFVIATQNPLSQMGTFPLPESQLDRFLMRISLGYPSADAERQMFLGGDPRQKLAGVKTRLKPEQLPKIRQAAEQVKTSDSLLDYLQRLVHHTRHSPEFACGLSPRGALALLRASKTWAFMHGRSYVIPEDLQTLLPPVVAHRIAPAASGTEGHEQALITELLNAVDIVPA